MVDHFSNLVNSGTGPQVIFDSQSETGTSRCCCCWMMMMFKQTQMILLMMKPIASQCDQSAADLCQGQHVRVKKRGLVRVKKLNPN